jgi:hypothetical protein
LRAEFPYCAFTMKQVKDSDLRICNYWIRINTSMTWGDCWGQEKSVGLFY